MLAIILNIGISSEFSGVQARMQTKHNGLYGLHCLINNAYYFLGESKTEHITLRENYFVALLTISNLIENLPESNFTEDFNSFYYAHSIFQIYTEADGIMLIITLRRHLWSIKII